MNNITFGDAEVGYYETVAGGAGAVSCVHRKFFFYRTSSFPRLHDLVLSPSVRVDIRTEDCTCERTRRLYV